MSAIRRALIPARTRVLTALVALVGVLGLTFTTAPAADAAVSSSTGLKVVRLAAAKKGTPYRYGGSSPRGFDCSGYTRWVYARVGKHLPRTSQAQYRATRHVSRSQRRSGDLVFFTSGSHVYHVGIYAGHGRVWHAPKRGDRVRLAHIWTSHVRYGRVR